MKIAIIGNSNANAVTENAITYADMIVDYLSKNNGTLVDGGCNGIIEYANKLAEEKKIELELYSPATNLANHTQIYDYECKSAKYIFEKDENKSLNFRFINRSLPLVECADVVFTFYGMWGTLSELVFATMLGKKIVFLLEENKEHLKKVYDFVAEYNNFDYQEKIFVVNNPKELENLLKNGCLEK